jgi:predicted secreted protein
MALKSQNTVLQMTNDDSPETFTAIEEVSSISGPDGSANLIDTTHLTSTGKEYLQGLADFGKITLECNFTAGTKQLAMRTKFVNQAAAHAYKLKIPDGAGQFHTFSFNAIVTSWALNSPTDDKVSLSIGIQISGSVVYALAA